MPFLRDSLQASTQKYVLRGISWEGGFNYFNTLYSAIVGGRLLDLDREVGVLNTPQPAHNN